MSPRPDLGVWPLLGYAGSRIDRAAERRVDAGALAAMEQAAGTRAYAIGSDLVVLWKDGESFDPAFALAQVRAFGDTAECAFLGLCDGEARFAVALTAETIEALKAQDTLFLTDLRSIAVRGLVEAEHLPPLAEGKSLLGWHARHRFCPNCGAPTRCVEAGWRRDCPTCKAQHFPRTDPVAIMLVVDGERCLLGRSGRFAANSWSCLAGFVEPGEAIEDAVRREVLEESAIVCGKVNYFRSQPWPFPSSLMIGCHAQALTRDIVVDHNELEDARWFTREEVAQMLVHQHPQGLITPVPIAIAYHIIREWVENGVVFDDATRLPVVLCAGIAVEDYLFKVERFPEPGEKARASDLVATAGGCAANAAMAVARLGGAARFAGPLGTDEASRRFLEALAKDNVDTWGVLRVAGGSISVSGIFIDRNGEKMVATRHGERLDGAVPPDPDALVADIDILLADNRFPDFVRPLCRAAQARSTRVVLDVDKATRRDDPLFATASHVIFSSEALRATTGIADLGAALTGIASGISGFLAVTDGPNEVLWIGDGTLRRQPVFAVKAVDTLGAGDTFHGGFALALAEGAGEIEAMRFAAAAAALKCTRFGGISGTPWRAEVAAMLARSTA